MTAPMLPGRYLQLLRQAAGLTVEQVAVRIAPRPSRWQDVAARIDAIEAGQPIPGGITSVNLVLSLAQAYQFSFSIWEGLAELAQDPASELPAPQVCLVCGCTWADPCDVSAPAATWRIGCHWRDPAETGGADICSACEVPAGKAAA